MHIDIITMHAPLNYGAVLQAYALKTYLTTTGSTVEIIDYQPEYITRKQKYSYVAEGKYSKHLLTRLIYIIAKFPSRYKRKHAFKCIQKELNLTTRTYSTYNQLEQFPPSADIYFCGSDQIWNTKNESHKDPAYYLAFVDNPQKRYGYAVSTNIELPFSESVKSCSIPLMKSMNKIAVRESTTKYLLEKIIGKEIAHVADPVFLLSTEMWASMAKETKWNRAGEKYILAYPIGDGYEVLKCAKQLAHKHNLHIYCISSSLKREKGIEKYITCTPYEFISLIQNACYVVTNSFHGTAFSIIFHRNFWTCHTKIASHRITSFLELLGLEERYTSEIDLNNELIDYYNVDRRLSSFIKLSKDYLNRILNQPISTE